MALFRLLNGLHVAPDPAAPEPPPGAKRASRTYSPGDLVQSDVDLVAKYGPERFALVSGTPTPPRHVRVHPAVRAAQIASGTCPGVFPGGQVSDGFQVALQRPRPGTPMSGPLPAEDHARGGVAGSAPAEQPAEPGPPAQAGQPRRVTRRAR